MIDFRKELAKFDFAALDAGWSAGLSETGQVAAAVNAALKRLGKEMSNINLQLEETLELYAEDKEKDKQIAALKKALTAGEEEQLGLVQSFLAVLDQLEDLYRYAVRYESDGWTSQLRLLWQNIAAELLLQGLSRIEGENTLFDPRLHTVVEVREAANIPDGLVVEVLRSGYLYRSRLLRKARVIVNKTNKINQAEEGMESDEQNHWN